MAFRSRASAQIWPRGLKKVFRTPQGRRFQMFGPIASLESYLFNAVNVTGRMSRSEYWWSFLELFAVTLGAVVADAITIAAILERGTWQDIQITGLWSLYLVPLQLAPNITAMIRRLHDTGRSGFWMLVSFVPFVGIIWFYVLLMLPSEPEDNGWGPVRTPRKRNAKTRVVNGKKVAHDPLAAYAHLLHIDAEPSPEVVERRRAEISEYYQSRILGGGAAVSS
ncbi:DUF805 domain-containing protein [Litorisediminicola beolgyonensis]|uniref:DUF805 domain-containing protein n=1 Tax=Litorisediminicola beolgyonensis TaxID=1173614 RepID=A0ABW3ZCP6_9RHOB